MAKDINDYITFYQQKNGKVKFLQTDEDISNTYKTLRDLGFRKTKLKNKIIYYKRENNNFTEIHPASIRFNFINFLETTQFINMPMNVELSEIINWIYKKNPIKANSKFNIHLNETLTEDEIHSLLLTNDNFYKHKFGIQQLLRKFETWNFNKSFDKAGSFCRDNPLYYKKIDHNKYLIFNHFNSKIKFSDGFDCWIATYKNEEEIGLKHPLDNENIKLSFKLDRDFDLIKQYLN